MYCSGHDTLLGTLAGGSTRDSISCSQGEYRHLRVCVDRPDAAQRLGRYGRDEIQEATELLLALQGGPFVAALRLSRYNLPPSDVNGVWAREK